MSYEDFPLRNLTPKPLLIVLSGPSGAGKDAVLSRLRESGCSLEFIITMTTRARRPDEKDGVHYRFVSKNNFQELIHCGELLEWANVYGNYYGVPRDAVKEALNRGKDAIVKVDVQGAATIKKVLSQAVFIFLAPSSTAEAVQRLVRRRTESASDLELRIKMVQKELEMLPLFDYLVFNRQGEIDRAVSHIKAIIISEKLRVTPRGIVL